MMEYNYIPRTIRSFKVKNTEKKHTQKYRNNNIIQQVITYCWHDTMNLCIKFEEILMRTS